MQFKELEKSCSNSLVALACLSSMECHVPG